MSGPRETTPARRGLWVSSFGWAAGVCVLALVVFGLNLGSEARFVDESAYLSQSYFADLWLTGDLNNPGWLTYPAVDLPPFPKYLIGLALRLSGYPRPGPQSARRWYHHTSYRAGTPHRLVAAQWRLVT